MPFTGCGDGENPITNGDDVSNNASSTDVMSWLGYPLGVPSEYYLATAKHLVLVGTYTRDRASGYLSGGYCSYEVRLITEADNPSFLLAHPQAEVIYCVNETDDYRESDDKLLSSTVCVSAFLKADLGSEGFFLDLINQQPSLGADPCHICINHDGRFLAVSNYSGGSFTTFGLEQDGYIESFSEPNHHTGSGPVADRQACAHVHSAMLVGEHLFMSTLRGSRQPLSSQQHWRGNGTQTHITAKSGAGPRFMANNDTSLFVLNELDSTLSSYDLATLSLSQTIHTLKDSSAVSIAAHLTITRDKRFLYLSNRARPALPLCKSNRNSGWYKPYLQQVNIRDISRLPQTSSS